KEYLPSDTHDCGRKPADPAELANEHDASGKREKASSIAREIETLHRANRCPAYVVAEAYGGFDDDAAARWLRHAADERDPLLQYINVDPELDHIRNTPLGVEILHKIGLPAG